MSRGPNFILGRDVIDVLLHFRRADGFVDDNHNNNSNNDSSNGEWRTSGSDNDDDDRVSLPKYNLPLVTSLYPPPTSCLSHQHDEGNGERRKKKNEVSKEDEDLLEPSIASLVEEVKSHLHVDDCSLHEVCIAGEGEVSL